MILEDSGDDGRAEKTRVFYQNPDIDRVHGVCTLGNIAIVSAPDRILLLADTDGDDKADGKKSLFTGKVLNPVQGQQDHAIHAIMFGPDGRLYFRLWRADGTLVKDAFGNPVNNSRISYQEGMGIRCELDGNRVEVLGHNFRTANTHILVTVLMAYFSPSVLLRLDSSGAPAIAVLAPEKIVSGIVVGDS